MRTVAPHASNTAKLCEASSPRKSPTDTVHAPTTVHIHHETSARRTNGGTTAAAMPAADKVSVTRPLPPVSRTSAPADVASPATANTEAVERRSPMTRATAHE